MSFLLGAAQSFSSKTFPQFLPDTCCQNHLPMELSNRIRKECDRMLFAIFFCRPKSCQNCCPSTISIKTIGDPLNSTNFFPTSLVPHILTQKEIRKLNYFKTVLRAFGPEKYAAKKCQSCSPQTGRHSQRHEVFVHWCFGR